MSKTKIKITIDGSQMNLELKNCSAITELTAAYTLVKNIAERLNTTSDEIFELMKDALEAEEEKSVEKAVAILARIDELENKVSE